MCPASPQIYDSERLASFYAAERPPVHEVICARIFAALAPEFQARTALDIGCGAGVSTIALAPYVACITGFDPYSVMLRHAKASFPEATFVQGSAEALPLKSHAYDMVTAAGSLSYVNPHSALAEISRVLVPSGYLAVYDFATGLPSIEEPLAGTCFKTFEQAFPWPPGYALDLRALPYLNHGLRLLTCEEFVLVIEMSQTQYTRYVMGETNVEAAVANGMSETSAWNACWEMFAPLFQHKAVPVSFRSIFAVAKAVRSQQCE
jgi:ubiquinone/menaquinone biosynthesis C-methylase UbiE